MKVDLDVEVTLSPAQGVILSFDQYLEVALDCADCGRIQKTVVFDIPGELGQCTPSGHTFDGNIGRKQVEAVGDRGRITYRCVIPLSYEYQSFLDSKYSTPSSPTPAWARVFFTASCPDCGRSSRLSTQNNIVRPYTCGCACGKALYTEEDPQPTFTVSGSHDR